MELGKILVTGASGQVGRFLIRRMIESKIQFAGLDIVEPINLPKFDFYRADIKNQSDLKKLKKILADYDTIIHLASFVEANQDVIKNGLKSIDLNVNGTLNLLEHMPNLRHICFASTYMVYGIPLMNPVTEEHRTEPDNIYGVSKIIVEKFLQVFSQKKGVELCTLRFMGIYGLESHYAIQAIPIFIKKISSNESPILFGGGMTKRNHVYVDDAIDAIFSWLYSKKSGTYNIGGPDAPNNFKIIELINKKFGKDIKPNFENSTTNNMIS